MNIISKLRYYNYVFRAIKGFFRGLLSDKTMSKTNADSLNQYQEYTNREQLSLEEKSKVQYNGVIQKMTGRDVKKHYLKHLLCAYRSTN